MNNSVLGKTMENLHKRVDLKLVRASKEDKFRRLIASPAFGRANIFDDELAAVQMHKSRLTLNRPICVGMSILILDVRFPLQSNEGTVRRALPAPLY